MKRGLPLKTLLTKAFFAFFLLLPCGLLAQDVAIPSLGGQRAANPLASTSVPASRYNVKAGPMQMLFTAGVGAEYNSNVNLSEDNPQSDFIITPRVGMGVYWPMTKMNRLRFYVQLGYQYYLNNTYLNQQTFVIDPGTEFVFNLYVNVPNLRITFFERPTITVNPVDNPTFRGNGDSAANYSVFNNTAGVNLLWDLNDVWIGAGYSNFLQYALNPDFDYTNRNSNQVFANISFQVLPYLRVGLEGSATSTIYTNASSSGANALNDSMSYTLGPFASGQLSRYVDWTAGVGWQITDYNNGNNPLNTGNYNDPYYYISINHTVNRFFSHRIMSGLEAIPSMESNYAQLFYLRYAFNWLLINNWSLGGSAFYENADESPGPYSENFDRLGASLWLNYQITKHWLLNFYFGVLSKGSSASFDGYNQQRFGANLTYAF